MGDGLQPPNRVIINRMSYEKRFHSGDSRSLMSRIIREVLDALLLIVILIAIAFLVYYLQIPPEDRPSIPDLIPRDTKTPTITYTAIPTRLLVLTPPAARTQTPTASPSLTAALSPTATLTPQRVSGTTPVPTSTIRLSVDTEIADGIERGNRIVEAIEAYITAKGFYPAALDDLVPDYLPELLLTITNQPFLYRVFERTTVMSPELYWVSFRVVSENNVTCTYYRRLQYWDCNFSSP
jgi:hypothetical protein